MVAGYPAAAREANIASGRVVMNCLVGTDGRLTDCNVKSDEPKGYGFGEAAMALSADFQVGKWSDEGLPTIGGRVDVPIRYELADEPPATQTPVKP